MQTEIRNEWQPVSGLKANWIQFALLILVNAFVGGMAGLERTLLPKLAEDVFKVETKTVLLSFIMVFGISKAVFNYVSGVFADRVGRRNLLIAGWIFALPVPFILMYAESWNWVIAANVLLGINQGLSWSSTVLMKIDLVGEKNRGLAMGLNEFAGYLAVALVAYLTSMIAERLGLRPFPFLIGVVLSFAGLIVSVFWIRDTRVYVLSETKLSSTPRLINIFKATSWKHPVLGSVTQAGLVNNLNDGMIWGLLPVWLISRQFTLIETGKIAAVYPAVWGITQLITGKLSDKFNKVRMVMIGMILQGVALIMMVYAVTFFQFTLLSVLLGIGTAMVYPVFMALIAEHTHPMDRAGSIGVFRLWRDLGYALGALITGALADAFGIEWCFISIGIITVFSGILMLRAKSWKISL